MGLSMKYGRPTTTRPESSRNWFQKKLKFLDIIVVFSELLILKEQLQGLSF